MNRSIISLTQTGAFAGTVLVNAAGTSVQLRQTVTRDGIVVTSGNANNDNLFDMPARKLDDLTQTRTVLLPVPAGTTAAEAIAKVAALPADACLYYMESDDVRDILGANQLAGIASGKSSKSIADYERDHSVSNPQTGEVMPGLFRATYFSLTPKADVDLRVGSRVVVDTQAAPLAQAKVAAPAAAEKTPF
jgi:hypothetical protein